VCVAVPTALPVDSTDDFARSTDRTLDEQGDLLLSKCLNFYTLPVFKARVSGDPVGVS